MKRNRSKKLILFDIDGTLVHGGGTTVGAWLNRVKSTVSEAFDREIPFEPTPQEYNGWPDMEILWDVARRVGVSPSEFEQKIPWMQKRFHDHLQKSFSEGLTYRAIEDCVSLLGLLEAQAFHDIGLITGNIKSGAALKLANAGIIYPFAFGLYGDARGDRNELAQGIFANAKKHFGRNFRPSDIVVIGDTVHDVRAGKHIGATVIAVTTGHTYGRPELAAENPDFLVDSLMEPVVRDFFGV